jgi:hypothetical protein
MVYPQLRIYRRRQYGGNFKGKKTQRGKQDGGFLGRLFGLGGENRNRQPPQKAQPINLNLNQRTSQNAKFFIYYIFFIYIEKHKKQNGGLWWLLL